LRGKRILGCISSHLPENFLPELAPLRVLFASRSAGCRGFIGPIPPPLWIRETVGQYLIFNGLFYITAKKACQIRGVGGVGGGTVISKGRT